MGRFPFGALLVAQLLATTGFMFVIPFMPLYVEHLGVADSGHAAAWAGVINGAAGATMALAAPLWGKVADRHGRKLMLLRATLAASVVILLMAFVEGPWQLLVLRLLQGTLTGTVPAATALVASSSPSERAGSRLGALQMVIFFAAGVGPGLGGVSADVAGLRTSFFIASALLAVSGTLVLLGVKEGERCKEEQENAERGETAASLPYRRLLPGLLTLFVVHVTITSGPVALPGFIEELAGSGVKVATQTGWLVGAGAMVAAVGSPLGGRVAGRFGARRLIVACLVLAGIAAIPQALAGSLPALWAMRLSTTFFLGCVIPVANLAIKDAAPPERQGAAFGVASSAVSAGFALGPLGGGLLSSAFGFWSAFLAPGVCLLGLAFVLTLTWMPRPAKKLGALWRTLAAHIMR